MKMSLQNTTAASDSHFSDSDSDSLRFHKLEIRNENKKDIGEERSVEVVYALSARIHHHHHYRRSRQNCEAGKMVPTIFNAASLRL